MSSGTGPGIYVHHPWCSGKCPYCDFNSYPLGTAPERLVGAYHDLLAIEIERRVRRFPGAVFDSIYFGGGTPSLCDPQSTGRIALQIRGMGVLSGGAEITIEANPKTIDSGKLEALLAASVNRVSIGVQSLSPTELKTLGRIHTAEDALLSIRQAKAAGFQKVGADLMYGVPGQTVRSLAESLEGAAGAGADHISAYALTLSPGTEMAGQVSEGALSLPPEEIVAEMYGTCEKLLGGMGFLHYEISNWARPGHECAHNLNCWRGGFYMGVGAGAHGYEPGGLHGLGVRYANVREPARYEAGIGAGGLPEAFREDLAAGEKACELVYLGLRTAEGVNLRALEKVFKKKIRSTLAEAAVLQGEGLLEMDGGFMRLTGKGMLIADSIALRLI